MTWAEARSLTLGEYRELCEFAEDINEGNPPLPFELMTPAEQSRAVADG